MQKKKTLDPKAREAFEQLENEFSKEFIINNPNAGITSKRLVELTERQFRNKNRK